MARPVAIVSGAASGIGQATAIRLARRGASIVAGHYPGDPHDIEQTRTAVTAAGGALHAVPVDVRRSDQVDGLADAALEQFGRIDVVVAAAGMVRVSPIGAMSDADWDDVLSVDLTGVMRLFRAAAQRMDAGGAFVGVSSVSGGVYGWDDHAHYAAAKSGVIGLGRSLAVELATRGIRVNTVVPGLIETPQTLDASTSMGADRLRRAESVIPLGRIGQADEVASLIEFLASEESSYLTGQNFVIDGGLSVRRPHTF